MKRGAISHRCPACGRRTYRRRRHVPALDERCQKCADLGYWPRRTITERISR